MTIILIFFHLPQKTEIEMVPEKTKQVTRWSQTITENVPKLPRVLTHLIAEYAVPRLVVTTCDPIPYEEKKFVPKCWTSNYVLGSLKHRILLGHVLHFDRNVGQILSIRDVDSKTVYWPLNYSHQGRKVRLCPKRKKLVDKQNKPVEIQGLPGGSGDAILHFSNRDDQNLLLHCETRTFINTKTRYFIRAKYVG